MLKLKLQYFSHLMWRADSFEKTLMLGKIEGRRRRGRQRVRRLYGMTNSMDLSLSKLQDLVMNREDWHAAVHEVKKSDMTQWLNWTETTLKGSTHNKLSKADMCYGDLKQDFFCTSWSTCYKSNPAVSPNIYFHLEYYHPYLDWLLPVQTSLPQRETSLTNYLGINRLPQPLTVFINVWYYLFYSLLVFFLYPS